MKHILPKTKIGNWSVSIFAIFVILVLLNRYVALRLVDTGAYENVTFISLWRMFYYLVLIVGGGAWLLGLKALIADKDRSLAIIIVAVLGVLGILVVLLQLAIGGF